MGFATVSQITPSNIWQLINVETGAVKNFDMFTPVATWATELEAYSPGHLSFFNCWVLSV